MPAKYYQDITDTAPASIKESLNSARQSGRLTESTNVTVNSLVKILRESNIDETTVGKVVTKLRSDGVNLQEHKIYRVPISRINHPERGEFNGNGRGYSSELWHNVMDNQQDAWKGLCGLADHPTDDNDPGSFKNSSIVWLGMEVDDLNDLVYGIGSFVGPYGHLAQEIIDCGGRVGFSSSGFGELMPDGHTVNPDTYQIERLADVVLNPSQDVYGAINDEQRNIEYSGPKEAVASTGNQGNGISTSYGESRVPYNQYNTYKESNSMENNGINSAFSKVKEKELRKYIKNYLNENTAITNPIKQLKDLEEIRGLIQEGQLKDLEPEVLARMEEANKKIEAAVEKGMKIQETEVTVSTPDGINITLNGDGGAAPVATAMDVTTPVDGEVPLDGEEEETFLESNKIVKGKKLTKAQEKSVRAYVNNFMNESHEGMNPLKVYTDLTEVLELVRESKFDDLEEGVVSKLEETAKQMEKDLNDAVTMKAKLGSKDLAEITEKTQGILEKGELLVEQCADYKTLCEALSKRNQELVKDYQALKLKLDLNESKEEDSVLARNQKVAELESKLEEATKKYDELDFAAGSKMVELNEALGKATKGNTKLEKELGIANSKYKEATEKLNSMKTFYESEIAKLSEKNKELEESLKTKEAEASKFGESIDNVLAQFKALQESNAQLTKEVKKLKEEKLYPELGEKGVNLLTREEYIEKFGKEPDEKSAFEESKKEEKKPTTLEEAVSFKDGGVEGFWNDLHTKYGEAVEPYEMKIRGQKTMREAQLAWMGVMNKVDANLKTVQETTFYKNGVVSQSQRLHKLHESGMLTSKDAEQDIDEVNARFLAKMKAAGLQ
jgi:hypothetical protein